MRRTVSHYMTRSPVTIESGMTIDDARLLMLRLGVRHLPVMCNEQLAGVVSERDVAFAQRTGAGAMPLGELLDVERLYVVDGSASLEEVANAMASRKLGSAAVFEQGHLTGIFTTVDACRALAEALHPAAP